MNPATDIYFSQGPMDVLDHSCSKLGFGGKMCIDGTYKFDEEKDETTMPQAPRSLDKDKIQRVFPELEIVNDKLLSIDIPCVIVSVKKGRAGHVASLHNSLCDLQDMKGIKMILYVERTVDANDLPVALWRFCNNVDPKRDAILAKRETFACIGFDGTIKTKDFDNFQRDWPNIIVADDKTIDVIDNKWNDLGIGEFIPSPSLKYKDQMYGEEAVVSV
jgi:4-hydroxy-3-polyprenylbenzoate decarboxylase